MKEYASGELPAGIQLVRDEAVALLFSTDPDKWSQWSRRWEELIKAGRSPMVLARPRDIGDWIEILNKMASMYENEALLDIATPPGALDPVTLRAVAQMLHDGNPVRPSRGTTDDPREE